MLQIVMNAGEPAPETDEIPSGDYSVSAFQRQYGLPVTGLMDAETYSLLCSEFRKLQELVSGAEPCVLRFPARMTLSPGQSHPYVFLAQAMLKALRQEYRELPEVSVHGVMDRNTEQSLRKIQHCAGLSETGWLDKLTWNRLSRLYRAMFDRKRMPTQG